nr:MAG TPA: hypothetical protein [Bacteriophage sp.]
MVQFQLMVNGVKKARKHETLCRFDSYAWCE